MPVQVFDRSDIEEIITAKPDSRFATTFLSNKYRKYAVKGETLQDKVTGEIFTRRPEDGRVVSFFQNKKYLHDLMMELKVLTASNDSFLYPNETHTNAFYLTSDYDLMTVNNDNECDIVTGDTPIPSDSTSYHNIKFNISVLSNGFFCRLTTRDSDKAVINWITNKYDNLILNYTGTDLEYLAEKAKFDNIPEWNDSNVVVDYDVTIIDESGDEYVQSCVDYIHANEEHCIRLSDPIVNRYYNDDTNKVYINIKKISYPKVHFLLSHMTDELTEEYNKFVYPDKKILATYLNIMSFIDTSDNVVFNENEFIIAMIDVPYCVRYMRKIAKIAGDGTATKLILSPTRPTADKWAEGAIWAEAVRSVYNGGVIVDRDSETIINQLELLISDTADSTYDTPAMISVVEANGGE